MALAGQGRLGVCRDLAWVWGHGQGCDGEPRLPVSSGSSCVAVGRQWDVQCGRDPPLLPAAGPAPPRMRPPRSCREGLPRQGGSSRLPPLSKAGELWPGTCVCSWAGRLGAGTGPVQRGEEAGELLHGLLAEPEPFVPGFDPLGVCGVGIPSCCVGLRVARTICEVQLHAPVPMERTMSGGSFPLQQPGSAPVTHTFLVSPREWWQDSGRSCGTLPGWDLGCLAIFLYSWAHTITARRRKMMFRHVRPAQL